LSKVKILIADDQEEILRAMVGYLGGNFDVVAAVNNGRHLVDAAILLRPDVIVSDVSMPSLTGPQAFDELTARGCHIPFVFVTVDAALVRHDMCSVVDKVDMFDELETAVQFATMGRVFTSRTASLQKALIGLP
jgi:CheY-like chemotaxis protein